MLGLLAHSLHYLLIAGGLVCLVGLLLPPLRERSSPTAFRAPATEAEHEQRVAALRSALQTGQLTVPRATLGPTLADLPAWTEDRDESLWRVVAASSSLAAAIVHAALVPDHLGERWLVGLFFILAALAQAWWSFVLTRRADDRHLLAGIGGSVSLILLWGTTRTVGLPFGLAEGHRTVGAWDLAAVTWELAVVIACVTGLRTAADRRRLTLGAPGRQAREWLLASAFALALLSLMATHG